MTPLVFISHSSEDRGVAAKVCEALERRGFGCWLASRDISPGENFQEAIVKAIRSVHAMVLVFTGHANNSNEIKKELALASQYSLVVIPLRVEDVLPSDAFLYEFSTRQWIDAFDDWERALNRLTDQVSGLAGEAGPAPSAPPDWMRSRAHTTSKRHPQTGWVAAGAAAIILVGGLAYWIARGPGSPAASAAGQPSAPVATADFSGKWVAGPLTNPYDPNSISTLHFEFDQSGETLLGTVTEKGEFGGAMKGIQDGRVTGNLIVFYTQGMTTNGTAEQPYKENYRGTLTGGAIEFVRQNDVPSGGLPQKFTAKRE